MQKKDIIVVGGGPSGCAAAISAARNGTSVLVIEQDGYLGGALTRFGVGPMMTFHAQGKQIIFGIIDEIIQRLVKKGKSPGHIRDSNHFCYTITPFDVEALKRELDIMLDEAGVEILFHTMLAGAEVENGEIKSITICNKDGINTIEADVFIDATGDGDLSFFSGVDFTKGRLEDGMALPMTMNMRYCCIDTERCKAFILSADPKKYPKYYKDINVMRESKHPVFIGFIDEFQCAKGNGEISIPRDNILFFNTDRRGEVIVNSTRILRHDSTNAKSLSDAEIEGRKQAEELDIFLRKYIPGFENAQLEFTGPSVGIRSSRQIIGLYTFTLDDYINCTWFEDTIAHSAYPVDLHNPTDGGTTEIQPHAEGNYYSLPYRIMVNKTISNLIVTGRCVSADFEAQAAIRTTPTAGALGEAAGAAAAMAVKTNKDMRTVNISMLRKNLKQAGMFLD